MQSEFTVSICRRPALGSVAIAVVASLVSLRAAAQAPDTPQARAQPLVERMIGNENNAPAHHDRTEYLSVENSARTAHHQWTEHVVETPEGRVRYLLAIDGRPLDTAHESSERGRLAALLADPSDFIKTEAAQKDDEGNARKLISMLGRGFVFTDLHRAGANWVMRFQPDPAYSPSGIMDRVSHHMSGTLAIDAAEMRLAHVDGQIDGDVSIGMGLVATVRTGTRFAIDKARIDEDWRTTHALVDFRGKVVLMKALNREQEVNRSNFRAVPPSLTLGQAVAIAELPYPAH